MGKKLAFRHGENPGTAHLASLHVQAHVSRLYPLGPHHQLLYAFCLAFVQMCGIHGVGALCMRYYSCLGALASFYILAHCANYRNTLMIAYLKGTIIATTTETATILINGTLGYEVYMPLPDLAMLKNNETREVFCYTHTTERTQELYGFLSKEARILFKLLIAYAPGIGPKSGLKILSKIKETELGEAISRNDPGLLEARGIPPKMAEKIIVGLKGKLTGEPSASGASNYSYEAQEALLNLGYNKNEIRTALHDIDVANLSTQDIVKHALKRLR